MNSIKPVRIALIGTGAFGAWHLKAMHNSFATQVVVLGAKTERRVAELSTQTGIPYCLDYDAICARDDIDAVDICVPAHLQAEFTIKALNSGKHVIAEKPMATNVDDAELMIKAAKKNNRILMIGHIERFNPSLKRAHSLIQDGYIGEPVKISTKRNTRKDKEEWEWDTVGILTHYAGHDLDIMRWLMNDEIVRVFAEGRSLIRKKNDQNDAICLILNFAKGGLGILDDTWCYPATFPVEENDTRIDVIGDDGVLFVNNLEQTLGLCNEEKGWWIPSILRWPGYRGGTIDLNSYALKDEIEHFALSVRGIREPILSGEEAIIPLRIIDAAKRSMKLGIPINI